MRLIPLRAKKGKIHKNAKNDFEVKFFIVFCCKTLAWPKETRFLNLYVTFNSPPPLPKKPFNFHFFIYNPCYTRVVPKSYYCQTIYELAKDKISMIIFQLRVSQNLPQLYKYRFAVCLSRCSTNLQYA